MTWHYSNLAVQTTLAAGCSNIDTSITVASVSGFPVSFPYTLVLDYNQPTAEVVNVTAAVGAVLTVTRGQDGTSASAHSNGAIVAHAIVGRDLNEPQQHIAATTGVHGLAGGVSVVGDSAAQTLTNKTIDGGTNTLTNLPAANVTGTFVNVTASGTVQGGTVTSTGALNGVAVTATGGATVSGGAVAITEASAGTAAETVKVTGDTNPRLQANADGKLQWGPGNAATDTNLYRSSSGVLRTDSRLDANRTNSGDVAFLTKINADNNERWRVDASGVMSWGPGGSSGLDVILYRDQVARIRTNQDFKVDGNFMRGNDTVIVDFFTSNGTWNPHALVSPNTRILVMCTGGGGGSGGVAATGAGQAASAAGGGGGGTTYAWYEYQNINAAQTVTVGGGGSGGAAGANNGNGAGTTSFGAFVFGNGGGGGQGSAANSTTFYAQGGAGGSGSATGSYWWNIVGGDGCHAGCTGGWPMIYGHGRSSQFAGPTSTGFNVSVAGVAGHNYGGGAAGAANQASRAAQAGATGGSGICIVYTFL